MSKKARATRREGRRSKPKTLKTFELVPSGRTSTPEERQETKAQQKIPVKSPAANSAITLITPEKAEARAMAELKDNTSARMAAQRQIARKVQRRNATALMTAEDLAYVKRDLITIGILSLSMIVVMIVLYVILGDRWPEA